MNTPAGIKRTNPVVEFGRNHLHLDWYHPPRLVSSTPTGIIHPNWYHHFRRGFRFISELYKGEGEQYRIQKLTTATKLFLVPELVAAMASLHCVLRSAFLASPCALPASPVKRLASSSSPGVASPRRIAISCSQAAEPRDAKAAVSCSRREVLGMGGVLAMGLNGLHAMVSPLEAEAEQVTCGKYNTTASGLAYCDSQVGSGIAAAKGMLIKAHYSGRLENGSEFDSSYKRRKPLTFRVGVGEVIRGWDQGILGTEGIPAMQAGGKRTLRIPANLGYGERGAGCRLGSCLIPPNSVLIFDVEFVGKA